MSELAMGPRGQRRGRGARERILQSARELFRDRGLNNTGIEQVCAAARVSKRTAYAHFGTKDELIAEYLRHEDPDAMPEVFDNSELAPRERLLAVFDVPQESLCPFLDAAVEIPDPDHPIRAQARAYKQAVTARLVDTARQARAVDPEALGEQLALLLDGSSIRTHTLGTDARPAAARTAATLIDDAIPPVGAAVTSTD